MATSQLRRMVDARPFQPFTIHVADGDKLLVKNPEFIWMTPGGRTVFVSHGEEEVAILDLLLVSKVTTGNGSSLPSSSETNS